VLSDPTYFRENVTVSLARHFDPMRLSGIKNEKIQMQITRDNQRILFAKLVNYRTANENQRFLDSISASAEKQNVS